MVLSVSLRCRERLESAFALTPEFAITRLRCVDEGTGALAMVTDPVSRGAKGRGRPLGRVTVAPDVPR